MTQFYFIPKYHAVVDFIFSKNSLQNCVFHIVNMKIFIDKFHSLLRLFRIYLHDVGVCVQPMCFKSYAIFSVDKMITIMFEHTKQSYASNIDD